MDDLLKYNEIYEEMLSDLLDDINTFNLKSVFVVRKEDVRNVLSIIIDYYVPFHDRLIFFSENEHLEPMPESAIKMPALDVVNELKSYLSHVKSQ